jgi:hypothetical protein
VRRRLFNLVTTFALLHLGGAGLLPKSGCHQRPDSEDTKRGIHKYRGIPPTRRVLSLGEGPDVFFLTSKLRTLNSLYPEDIRAFA